MSSYCRRQSSATTQASHKSENKIAVEEFEKECLLAHNEYRRMHGVPDLRLNAELCKYARDWAFMLLQLDKFTSRTNCLYGENLYVSYSPDPDVKVIAREACKSWYMELYDYDFDVEPRTRISGYFTQMIWKNTKELGVGMAKSSRKVIVVANYNPMGNIHGDYVANCPKPIQ